MSATAFDLRHPDVVAQELAAANRRLGLEPGVPDDVRRAVESVVEAIREIDDHALATVNPWLWIAVQRAALGAQAALHDAEPAEQRRRLRLAVEQLRFLFARIAERRPLGEDRSANEIARWLEAALPAVPQQRKAELVGVGLRTYQRWLAESGAQPNASDERRLRIIARLVNQLRHSLTGPGVVEWFEHPRADLGDRPVDVLDDPQRLEELIAAAAASRGHVAA